MLAYLKFDWSATYGRLFSSHSTPYFQYIRMCYFLGGHTGCAMNRVNVNHDEFRQDVNEPVRILVRHIFVQFVPYSAMSTFDDGAFNSRIATHLELNAFFLQHVLDDLFKNSLPLSVRKHIGRLCEYLARIERNAEDTALPIFTLSGTMCRNLKNTSITDNKYYICRYIYKNSVNL
jgi:hypothetical protein